MKTSFLIISILLSTMIIAQEKDSIGYLSNLKGKGLCIRQGLESNLKIPFFFFDGDKVRILSGKAVIVLKTEEEVNLGSGESYTLVSQKDFQMKNSDLLMYRNTKQSTSSFKMRNLGESRISVFPSYSKIIDPGNAAILLRSKLKNNYFFKLINAENKEVVYQLSEVKDSLIKLDKCNLERGARYTWMLKYPEYDISGEFSVLKESQAKMVPEFDFYNRASYTIAFNYYSKEELYFDAYRIIEMAIKAYPDDDYFKYLRRNLLGE